MTERVDILVVGGGINGCAIARDASGRGLKVMLVEQGDLAGATSSASTKLFHGGLRYLEHCEFRLVHEALVEREVLLRAMPHISWPLRFVLPHHDGLRPAWLLRLGLFVYDHLGGRRVLPPTRRLDLSRDPAGKPLRDDFRLGFEYSDCWVDDSRLVVLTARDAAARGASILTRTRFETASARGAAWHARLRDTVTGVERRVTARAMVNASGPWVEQVRHDGFGREGPARIRLVRGSHIITGKLFDHDRAYILQQADGRVVFVIPYEGNHTLIGTTDEEHFGPPGEVFCTDGERDYLLQAVSAYFRTPVTAQDVVRRYAGVRPLHDDGAKPAAAATRDYVLALRSEAGAPALDVFGGKITTHRRLAEAAMAKLAPFFSRRRGPWTAAVPLPGGDFPWDGVPDQVAQLRVLYPFLTAAWAERLVRAYGSEAGSVLGPAQTASDLGADLGATLTERELDWMMEREWARTAEDVLWRRSKLGLRLTAEQVTRLQTAMAAAGDRALAV